MVDTPSHDFLRLVQYYKETYPVHDILHMQFEDCSVQVGVNSRELGGYLRKYYQSFVTEKTDVPPEVAVTILETPSFRRDGNWRVKPPEAGKKRVKEEYRDFSGGRIIRKRNTGLVFFVAPGINLAVGSCREHPNQVINFVNNRYIQWMLWRTYVLLHASGVSKEKKGLGFAGFAGRGKSTLALQLVGEGLDFVSNDRLLLRKEDRKDIRMYGVPKLPRVNPGTLLHNRYLTPLLSREKYDHYRSLPVESLWNAEEKYDVDINCIFGEKRFTLSTRLHGLGILNWRQGDGKICIQEIDLDKRKDLFRTFMKSPGLFFEPEPGKPYPDLTPSRYMDVLRDIPVFEVTGGVDFTEATAFFRHFLECTKEDENE